MKWESWIQLYLKLTLGLSITRATGVPFGGLTVLRGTCHPQPRVLSSTQLRGGQPGFLHRLGRLRTALKGGCLKVGKGEAV